MLHSSLQLSWWQDCKSVPKGPGICKLKTLLALNSSHHKLLWCNTQTQANPKASSQEHGQVLKRRKLVLRARSSPDLPSMGLQDAVCPALRAEWGSSSNSLYSVSMPSFPSPKLPSFCSLPRTLTMYFFCNKAWPVLQASALASTQHGHSQWCKLYLHKINRDILRYFNKFAVCSNNKDKKTNYHNREREPDLLQVCSLTVLTHALLFLQPLNQLIAWEALLV